MSDKFIRMMLSSGHIEEGILEKWAEKDESDGSFWVVISIKGPSPRIIKINRKYIACYQIEEIIYKNSLNVEEENRVNIHVENNENKSILPNKKLPFNTKFILNKNNLAEQRALEDAELKKKLSEEYSENVYSPSVSIFKK